MKKLFIFIIIISISVTLSACGKKDDNAITTDKNTQQNNEEQQKVLEKEETSFIKDNISKSIPLKCTFTDASGSGAILYFKNNIIRVDAIKKQPTDNLVSEVIKDNNIYIWTDASNQGMIIDLSIVKPGDQTFKIDETPIYSTDDIIKKIDEQKDKCVQEDVSDSLFEIPSNIIF